MTTGPPGPRARDELTNTDTGVWSVTTEVSRYLLDLDNRRLIRFPGVGSGRYEDDPAIILIEFHYRTDGRWQPLVELLVCRVTEPLSMLCRAEDGSTIPWRSTIVSRIEPTANGTDLGT
jgi:hypothetical protein